MIQDLIDNEISEFENKGVKIVDGVEYNQIDIIDGIYRRYNSKFESGSIDDQGDRKYFYNITRAPANVATKMVDFDTKNIKVLTAEGGDPNITWFFNRDLKFWMKDKGFGKILNRILYELPIFGSVVLKIVDNIPYFVDLRNFVVEQSTDNLKSANYIIERHNYTAVDFRRVAKRRNWDNWEEALDKFRDSEEDNLKVFERYGEDPEDEYKYKRYITASFKGKESSEKTSFVLDETTINPDDIPYFEFHWEKIPGRWLGVGRVEITTEAQIRVNELVNQQVKSSYFNTLRLWQTRDETINRNLLTDFNNGAILPVDSEITQVDMTDRNLSHYNQEIQNWLMNRDETTFSHDVTRGERLPSGTPLGSARLAAGMAGSYFDQIRDSIAEDVKQLLYSVIIPNFKQKQSQEHTLNIAGEDLDKINDTLISQKVNNEMIDFIKRKGKLPNKTHRETVKAIIKDKVKRGKEKLVKIPQGFYKNLKYKLDIVITGEMLDSRVKSANLFAALQAVTADPTLLSDPTKKKFFYRWMEQGGLSPADFEPETSENPLNELTSQFAGAGAQTRAGGGISAPTTVEGAIPNERTI